MDYDIAHALDRFSAHHDGFEDVLGAYTGAAEILFVAILVALFLAVPGRWRAIGQRAAVAAAASAGLALLIGTVISTLVDRPRPFVAHPDTIHAFLSHAADPSFPSDHATASFAIAIAVLLRQRLWGAVLLVLAFVVSAGRVFLGLHYPSDVAGGALLGTLCALVLFAGPTRRLLDAIADAVGGFIDGAARRLLGRGAPEQA
jgi:undecaprenyl-diphosphatase